MKEMIKRVVAENEASPVPPKKRYKIKKSNARSNTDISTNSAADNSECPAYLIRSRDYLFGGLERDIRNGIRMDTVASFSVTESRTADAMTGVILEYVENIQSPVIFDGMACVGGNTISFSKSFPSVLSNEYDSSRYEMLKHNVRDVLKCENVTFFNASILTLGIELDYDVLFLDPEWGGPDYKYKKNLRLTISDESVESFVLRVFERNIRVSVIALKLPVNYDNRHLQQVAESHGFRYTFFSNFKKMTLTILQRL